MKKKDNRPITHLIIDTSSSNEHDNGDCDYCLIPMSVEYIAYLFDYMGVVRKMHRADNAVYSLECWDGSALYFRDNDKLGELRDVGGRVAADVERGEPILLAVDPQFNEDDYQRVDCLSVQILSEDVWWTAYIKHTGIRIESAHVDKKILLRIFRSLGGTRERSGQPSGRPVPPVVRQIHDLLYLDLKDGREFYNPDKAWDADMLAVIAEVVARHIPRPTAKEANDG